MPRTDSPPAPVPTGPGVVVITAHPQMEHSRVNRRLMGAARALPHRLDGRAIQVRDVYDLYPDYDIDVGAEQAALLSAELIVWQHPIHWYNMPALMKLWVDEVLAFGWAYGPGGTALRGKDLWLVATTGGPEESYRPEGQNRHPFDAFLPAYVQTAQLCGMRFLPPLVLHGAHHAGEAQIRTHVQHFTDRLRHYPNWSGLDTLLYGLVPAVPSDERPDGASPALAAGAA